MYVNSKPYAWPGGSKMDSGGDFTNDVIGFEHDDVRTRFRVRGLRPSRDGTGPIGYGIIAPTVAVRLNGLKTHGRSISTINSSSRPCVTLS